LTWRKNYKYHDEIKISGSFPRISYTDAMKYYGSDKPDIRFGMKISSIKQIAAGAGFSLFDSAEYVGGISVPGAAGYTRKQTDELTEWVKRPQIGAKGLVLYQTGRRRNKVFH